MTTEDATQNAALAAILFLAGGVGKDSPHFIITLVGSDPTVRPTALDPKQASSMLNQRLQLVQQQKVRYLCCSAHETNAHTHHACSSRNAMFCVDGHRGYEHWFLLHHTRHSCFDANMVYIFSPTAAFVWPFQVGMNQKT